MCAATPATLVPIAPDTAGPPPDATPPPAWRGRGRPPERRACPRARVFVLCAACGARNHIRCAYCKACFKPKAPVPGAVTAAVPDQDRDVAGAGASVSPPPSAPPSPPRRATAPVSPPFQPPPPPPPSLSSPPILLPSLRTAGPDGPAIATAWVLCTWPLEARGGGGGNTAAAAAATAGPAAVYPSIAVPVSGAMPGAAPLSTVDVVAPPLCSSESMETGGGTSRQQQPATSTSAAGGDTSRPRPVLAGPPRTCWPPYQGFVSGEQMAAAAAAAAASSPLLPPPAASPPPSPPRRALRGGGRVAKPRPPSRQRRTVAAAVHSVGRPIERAPAARVPSAPASAATEVAAAAFTAAAQEAAAAVVADPRTPPFAPGAGPALGASPDSSWSLVSTEPPPPLLPPSSSSPSWSPTGASAVTTGRNSGSHSGSRDGGGSGGSGGRGDNGGHGWDIWTAAEPWDTADPAAEAAVHDAGILLDEILGEAHATTGLAF